MMHFAYAGQAYAGVQVNPSAKIDSVQSVIERALYHFQPNKEPLRFGVSSRTDRGVHALHNTATFDWFAPIDVTNLVEPLNNYLSEHGEQVRVLRIHSISPQFHFRRHCLGRKYVYRLGFLDEHEFTSLNLDIPFLKKKKRHLLRDITPATFNLFEKDHITYIEPPFNLEAFRQGIELFQVRSLPGCCPCFYCSISLPRVSTILPPLPILKAVWTWLSNVDVRWKRCVSVSLRVNA